MSSQRYEVQEFTICDSWVNNWHDEHEGPGDEILVLPSTYESHDEALAAIYEFFANLARAGMAHSYDIENYRVRPFTQPLSEGKIAP